MEPKYKPLASDKFIRKMDLLHKSKAKELHALHLRRWLSHTSHLLDIDSKEYPLGYVEKVDDPALQISFPLMGHINKGMAHHDVAEFMQDLYTLPQVQRDKDYTEFTEGLLRACETMRTMKERFPGYKSNWDAFFDTLQRPVFENAADIISNPERKPLFQALGAIASGRVPSELKEFESELLEAHSSFYEGRTKELADLVYGITTQLVENEPPPPPGGGSGDGSGSSSTEDEDGSGGGGTDEEDPFAQLGSYLANADPESAPPLEYHEAAKGLEPPDPELNVDLDKLEALERLKTDVHLPEGMQGMAYLTYQVPQLPGMKNVWDAYLKSMRKELKQVRNIIEEHYRVGTIIERGLKSGRADPTRLYRAPLGDANIFRRTTIDSIGHADIVVLLDESGSMSAIMNDTPRVDFKSCDPSLFSTSDSDNIMGMADPTLRTRAGVARMMAILLTEASRHLPGFNIKVAGYSSVAPNVMGPMKDAAESIRHHYKNHLYSHYCPTVRTLATREHPYSLLSTSSLHENADYQAYHWALEQLKHSNAPQKAILYLADGEVTDSEEEKFKKMVAQSKRSGIYTYFMNLSGSKPHEKSALAKLPRKDVDNFSDMIQGLKEFLNAMVASL